MTRSPDISVIVPFSDDEDIIGRACTRVAEHLTTLGLDFELLAIEEDCGDNSHALLGLLRPQLPQLSVLYADGPNRAYATAARQARGRVLWMLSPEAALRHLAPFARAFRRVDAGELDAVVVEDRFAVCHRTRSLDALMSWRGRRFSGFRRRLDRQFGRQRVERIELGGSRWSLRNRSLLRLVAALKA
jgi:hypothetical protein